MLHLRCEYVTVFPISTYNRKYLKTQIRLIAKKYSFLSRCVVVYSIVLKHAYQMLERNIPGTGRKNGYYCINCANMLKTYPRETDLFESYEIMASL